MRVWQLLAIAWAGVLPSWLCADAPTTAPAGTEIAELVGQLSDADFRVREQATQRLHEIGDPALASLQAAAQSNDPEVRSRAEMLIKRLERQPIPGPAAGPGQSSPRRMRISVSNASRTIDVDEGGRTVQITEKPDGVELTIIGVVEGKPATWTCKAKTPEQLRAEEPEAYAIYERYSQPPAVMPGPVRLPGAGQGFDPNALWPPPVDPLEELDEQLQAQMRKAQTPAKDQWKVLDLLNQARNARDADPAMTPKERDQQLQAFYARCDELRKLTVELKLPDPGSFLPLPANARLGVQLTTKPNEMGKNDLVVQRVLADSRAERLGLKAGDILVQINDAKVRSLEELQRALLKNKPPVVVKILRQNQPLELAEKAAP
ncbi:MAG TPA: PDZ domain-containing protein [Tepidisphaeraceae bacterium]|nr:PDZ domain-containing protein [Tepidisphaeraceae bacterium]